MPEDPTSLGPEPPYDLTDRRVVHAIEQRRRVQPRKEFSQHWLVDREALERIIAAAELTPATAVLEVGAGMGVLTAELARRAGRVVAVEIEREVLPVLREMTGGYANVEIINEDLLKVDPAQVFGDTPYVIAANLPYAITGLTLRHFLEAAHPPERMVILIQYEVAQRITAQPGDMSMLALSTQFYSQPHLVAKVPAQSFLPRPEVDSAIVVLDRHAPPATGELRDRLFAIAKISFSQRRKQLHNVLPAGLHLAATTVQSWLAEAGITPDRRPQTLSVAEWVRLAETFPLQRP